MKVNQIVILICTEIIYASTKPTTKKPRNQLVVVTVRTTPQRGLVRRTSEMPSNEDQSVNVKNYGGDYYDDYDSIKVQNDYQQNGNILNRFFQGVIADLFNINTNMAKPQPGKVNRRKKSKGNQINRNDGHRKKRIHKTTKKTKTKIVATTTAIVSLRKDVLYADAWSKST